MCCVLQGAERVFPSNGGKHGAGTGSSRGVSTSVGTQDLPLESLWAAGLDEDMGFPQRCSYANHHTTLTSPATGHASANPEELWRERNLSYRYIAPLVPLQSVGTLCFQCQSSSEYSTALP